MNTFGYVYQNPIRYTDPLGLDSWLGGEVRAGFHMFAGGLFGGVTNVTNALTGENCFIRVACLRIGPGILIGGGTGVIGTFNGAHCGKDLNGITVGIGFDIIVPGAPGAGGSVDAGGGLGISGGAGADGGAGASAGVDFCQLKLISCTNTPKDCTDCE